MNRSKSLLFSFVMLMLTGNIAHANRDFLWNKVSEHCVPEYVNKGIYQPCRLVDMNKKIAIYKVDVNNDKYQYLLLPTDKVTGAEDETLQKDNVPNYLYSAWLAKTFLTERLGRPIQERFISLTLNAQNARSQDQMHIHISCLSKPANEALSKIPEGKITTEWSTEQISIPPYTFYYRKVSLSELIHNNLFQSISEKVRQEKGRLEYSGVGLVNRGPEDFIMLVGIGNRERGVSAERIQDHECLLAEQ